MSEPTFIHLRNGRNLQLPSDQENDAINRGIAEDPDTVEITEEMMTRMKPLLPKLSDH